MRRHGIILALTLAVAPEVSASGAEPPRDLSQVLERMGRAQERLKTLSADFVQEKILELLAEPDVSKGRLYYEAPSKILWEYREPDQTILLIDERTLLAYYPDLKKADRVDIQEKRQRYDRYFAITLGSQGPMQEYFEVDLARESGFPGTHMLILTPKSKRIEKYITEIRLWVDGETYLPRRFEYHEENGDSTTYTLQSVVVNEPIPVEKFALQLPPDVEVTDLSGGFKSRRP